jgi:hypothetical protein
MAGQNYNQFVYFSNYDAFPPTAKVRSRVSPDIGQSTILALVSFTACLKKFKGKIISEKKEIPMIHIMHTRKHEDLKLKRVKYLYLSYELQF